MAADRESIEFDAWKCSTVPTAAPWSAFVPAGKGIGPDGQPKGNYEPGIDIHAKVTVLGEGARGSLTKALAKNAGFPAAICRRFTKPGSRKSYSSYLMLSTVLSDKVNAATATSINKRRIDRMIIIGELINASRKAIGKAIKEQDTAAIQQVASDQAAAGADYIDVNAGIFMGKEPAYLKWLVETVQAVTDKPCAIDSPDPKAIEAALSVHAGTAMINSISLEKERYDNLLPIVSGTDLKVIALCMSDAGMPEAVEDRLKIADELVNSLVRHNVKVENIFVDPLVQPMSVNNHFGTAFLDAVEAIVQRFPGIHTACGLSNISYGLPARKFLNQTFMTMAIAKGLDGAIVNPLDRQMMANIVAAEALAGKDDYCMNYLKAFRSGMLET